MRHVNQGFCCNHPECAKPARTKGMCIMHYSQKLRAEIKAATPPKVNPESLRGELEVAKRAYQNAFTLDARMRWRRKIDAIETDVRQYS